MCELSSEVILDNFGKFIAWFCPSKVYYLDYDASLSIEMIHLCVQIAYTHLTLRFSCISIVVQSSEVWKFS